jgi:uncharacterized membrane protein YidH (DUF202 family)
VSDREKPGTGPVPDREIPIMGPIVTKTSRFSREVVATMISLASAAFGVVAALAWNSAIQAVFNRYFGTNARISALFVYAFLITLIGVIVIITLARLAARLSVEPVEFKYPGVPKH